MGSHPLLHPRTAAVAPPLSPSMPGSGDAAGDLMRGAATASSVPARVSVTAPRHARRMGDARPRRLAEHPEAILRHADGAARTSLRSGALVTLLVEGQAMEHPL